VTELARSLAAAIDDEPRWIDIRGMLLSPHARVTGGDSLSSGFVVRLLNGAVSTVGVVGRPDPAAIREAVSDLTTMTPVICQVGDAAHVRSALTGWVEEFAIVHTRPPVEAYPDQQRTELVRLLRADEASRLSHLPAGLRHEMTAALAMVPVAATFVGDRPVSFSYPVWLTESWWDVSIDTLEDYRRRGYAHAAFQLMSEEMRATGREPIWSALASNTASLRLAEKIGFTPVSRITVFSRDGGWTLFSGGFTGDASTSLGAGPATSVGAGPRNM
jgi:RimJ/RimL family protein N-acetyltransferase